MQGEMCTTRRARYNQKELKPNMFSKVFLDAQKRKGVAPSFPFLHHVFV